MPANPITVGLGSLLGDVSSIAQACSSPQGVINLITQELKTISGPVAPPTDLWPLQVGQQADRLIIAGHTDLQSKWKNWHNSLEQGRFNENSLGDACAAMQAKSLDINEKIMHYLALNQLAIDGKLPDNPRAVKFAYDSIKFIQQVQTYLNELMLLVAGLQANAALLLSIKNQMVGMIDNNLMCLTNLLNEICNWGLPALPAMTRRWSWNGFNFNALSGFHLNQLLSTPNFSFSFGACTKFAQGDLAAFFNVVPSEIDAGPLTLNLATPTAVLNGSYGDPTQYTSVNYQSTMQSTTSLVLDPTVAASTTPTSLPNPAAVISNYALPPSVYTSNNISAVAALAPIVIQPDDPDYTNGVASTSREANLRALLIHYVNLSEIVPSYEPNLVAAWILYLGLNRAGRNGTWLPTFEAAYTTLIQPSLTYLQNTAVPWNNVLGGTGVTAAPAAIPLIALLKADTTNHLLWELSYIEASLLGYPRTTTWDSAADSIFVAGATGTDLDYMPTTVAATPTATVIAGLGTASYPESITYPQALALVLNQVIVIATAAIAAAPGYQSTRPQFRYTYDLFAQATLVDRYTQFWREFHFNLTTLLAASPYLVAFVASYPDILNSAINPLASPTDYTALQADVATRNQSWTPGSDLPPIPSVPASAASSTPPSDQTNGWTTGSFDATAFLSRPDIQAQTLPVQLAMLNTNQSFSSLMTTKAAVSLGIQNAIDNANAAIASAGIPGWGEDTTGGMSIPPGAATVVSFDTINFNQTGYVTSSTTVSVVTAGSYMVYGILNWDPAGAVGTRTINLLQNGAVVATASADDTGDTPFVVPFSTEITLALGDILQIQASHSLGTSQNLIAGSSFLGLLTNSGTATVSTASSTDDSMSPTLSVVADADLAVLTAVTIQTDGGGLPLDPTITTPGVSPFLDGITLTAATAGQPVALASSYGQVYVVDTASFTPGSLLYVGADGVLTQDFSSLSSVRWIICVGKAISVTSFVFEPHIPTNTLLTF